MSTTWKTKYGPRRVRHDPPTIEEAIAAARDLSDDTQEQVEIAAGLIDLPPEQVRAALAKGDFETAHGELAKASVLAETDPNVAVAQARLEVTRTEPVWLRLKIASALDAAAAQKAQNRKRKPTPAEAAAEAEQAEKDANTLALAGVEIFDRLT